METVPHGYLGLLLALGVGLVLGLLGGGGSILAVPIFLYVFRIPPQPAIAMSLAVVGMSAGVGFMTHWRQGTVHLRIAVPFGALAMVGAFFTARVAHHVPDAWRLRLFIAFAFTAALFMLRDSVRSGANVSEGEGIPGGFSPLLGVQALAVGALTSLIGAGGGFLIVPALVFLARVPLKAAVGSSLLIIAMNALSGFAGYVGRVPIHWTLVGSFTGVAAVGAVLGTRLVPHVPQRRIKQGFAVMILVLGSLEIARRLRWIG